MLFHDVQIDEVFAFKYEVLWSNYQAELGKFSPAIPYVPILVKVSDKEYRFFDFLVDNRKAKGYRPREKGYAHSNAEVLVATKTSDGSWSVKE